MRKLIMLQGLPASGKTTWAKQHIADAPVNSIKRVNKDDLRVMLDGGVFSKGNEAFVLEVRDYIVKQALDNGKSVIVDDTNLHPKHEETLKGIAKDYGVQFQEKYFEVDVQTCLDRDSKRDNPVGQEVILSMYNKFMKPEPEAFVQREHIPELPDCIICDIDGTLANHEGVRGHFEYDKVYSDGLHSHIAWLVDYVKHGADIVLVSGREDSCREETERWLATHGIQYDALWMRKTGDHRKDYTVKEELFREHIEAYYNVMFVLDDRTQVVDMWRGLGIPCLQVAPGDF